MKQKNLDLAIQLRHELHAHPELSYQEDWTKQHLMDFLKEHTANLEIIDKGKYFYAKYFAGDDKPNIAFRADFDAIPIPETIDLPWKSQFPGVSHKCGHDGHASTLAGFALEVDQKVLIKISSSSSNMQKKRHRVLLKQLKSLKKKTLKKYLVIITWRELNSKLSM